MCRDCVNPPKSIPRSFGSVTSQRSDLTTQIYSSRARKCQLAVLSAESMPRSSSECQVRTNQRLPKIFYCTDRNSRLHSLFLTVGSVVWQKLFARILSTSAESYLETRYLYQHQLLMLCVEALFWRPSRQKTVIN